MDLFKGTEGAFVERNDSETTSHEKSKAVQYNGNRNAIKAGIKRE
jgi:hypothetical protein